MITLFWVGVAINVVGQLLCVKIAFSRSVLLAVVVLLVPFASIVVAIKYWEEGRTSLALNVLGALIATGAGISLLVNNMSKVMEAKARTAPVSAEQRQLREGLLKNCRETTPAPGVCECVVDRVVERYPGPELSALVKEHETNGAWRAGHEEFLRASESVCATATPPAGSGGGPGTPAVVTAAETAPTTSPNEWTSASFDGKAVLKEALSSARNCTLTCAVGGKEVWKANGDCIATGRDFRFVSVDCERVVVVHNVKVDGHDWKTIDAATVYKRSKKAYDVGAMTVVKDPRRVMASPTWLQGVLGLSGEPPRYSKDGQTVEIDCVDGKHSQIPLVAAEEPEAAPAEEKAPAPVPKKKKRKH